MKTFKQVMTMIGQVKATSAKLDNLVHATAVQCLCHAEAHGDVRLMGSLLEQIGKGYRRKGLIVWVEMFSPVRVNGDGKIGLLKPEAKNYTPFKTDEAEAKPFWTLAEAEEQTKKPLTLEALKGMVAALEKKIDRAAEGKGGYEIGEGANIMAMKEYVNKLRLVA
jgi:hypothetical protein